MGEYEENPCQTIVRADGSTIRFYRSKTNPYAFLPIQDDGTVFVIQTEDDENALHNRD
jgi:hypothetical protein